MCNRPFSIERRSRFERTRFAMGTCLKVVTVVEHGRRGRGRNCVVCWVCSVNEAKSRIHSHCTVAVCFSPPKGGAGAGVSQTVCPVIREASPCSPPGWVCARGGCEIVDLQLSLHCPWGVMLLDEFCREVPPSLPM